MKEYEDFARLKVQEAIQSGLRSQQINRAFQEKKKQHRAAAFDGGDPVVHFKSKPQIRSSRVYKLYLLVQGILFWHI